MSETVLQRATAAVPVVAVLRGLPPADALSVGCAAVEGGLQAVEITMDSPGATEAIAALVATVSRSVAVGAGTIVTMADVDRAVEAGAAFLVSPHLDASVLAHATSCEIPMVPGVASPSELHAAIRAGAAMVKLFPAAALGTTYVSALRGPYPDVPIMVSGGITVDDASAWLASGATVLGIGTSSLGRSSGDVRERISDLATALSRPRGDGRVTAT